jgi:hypothetical protein
MLLAITCSLTLQATTVQAPVRRFIVGEVNHYAVTTRLKVQGQASNFSFTLREEVVRQRSNDEVLLKLWCLSYTADGKPYKDTIDKPSTLTGVVLSMMSSGLEQRPSPRLYGDSMGQPDDHSLVIPIPPEQFVSPYLGSKQGYIGGRNATVAKLATTIHVVREFVVSPLERGPRFVIYYDGIVEPSGRPRNVTVKCSVPATGDEPGMEFDIQLTLVEKALSIKH